jgi:hypothetical protein
MPARKKPMRKRSKKRPKHEDRSVIAEYMVANKFCELSEFLWRQSWDKWVYIPLPDFRYDDKIQMPSRDLHHICPASKRADVVTNILAVCRLAHNWAHDHRADASVLAIAVKVRKGELDREEMSRILRKNFDGWFDLLGNSLTLQAAKDEWLRLQAMWV